VQKKGRSRRKRDQEKKGEQRARLGAGVDEITRRAGKRSYKKARAEKR
jgi:hypothetical protein